MVDPIRLEAASNRFRAFFDELHHLFLERDDVLLQLTLALLSREHLLVTGPPGTAKSQLASAVFGRILDEETGEPSLYARQIGESTVQTDLIGPIDFKTLMETGRTEHFTDEGMLGAVHAFLDEIFDGRDMLLRSALNVLHEREVKQGGRVKRGRIECALMTTNRYIADVLESSRETLLAFVDRIAFVSFVPRGFADPNQLGLVLRRHVGGSSRALLESTLSVQDLDALQHLVDEVYVSDPVCDGLATLLERFDRELNAAVRADPAFVPTRYISTRTAVRSGRVLRAAVVADRILHNPKRSLEVLPSDFKWLRLHLLLSGPTPDQTEALIGRESDPNERRQLGIVRTERSIFESCLAQMPPIHVKPRPATVDAPRPDAVTVPADTGTKKKRKSEPPPPEDKPRVMVDQAIASKDATRLLAAMRELGAQARTGSIDAARAGLLVKEATGALTALVLRRGIDAAAGGETRPIGEVVKDLSRLAAEIEDGTAGTRAVARWLRGRALVMVDEAAGHAAGASSTDIVASIIDDGTEAQKRARARIEALESLYELRRELLGQGAVHETGEEKAWQRAVAAAEDDITILLDISLRSVVTSALKSAPARRLAEVLAAIAPELDRLDVMAARLAGVRGAPSSLKEKVTGPRLGALIEVVFKGFDARDRTALVREVEALVSVLGKAGLARAIAAEAFLGWSAEALLRGDVAPNVGEGQIHDYDGYRRVRAAERRVSSAYTLAEIALLVAGEGVRDASSPAEAAAAIAAACGKLPEAVRGRVVAGDLARIGRSLDYLERFWRDLENHAGGAEASLRAIVQSRFFDLLWDEGALTRFALEARNVAEVFPAHAAEVDAVRHRIDALDARTRTAVTELFRQRSDAAWAQALRTGNA
ncbi:AAA family ATPase [Polyangium sp. rjm3]|uniref:AAA family ATPase n=1 Tax=Polyangium mundeleinium TaxID=2995306 RepID=A0ABT5EDQ9_9BACT|nr:AAA family ATPase [Polyangium mundeleinium]MDC0739950.1 AAA family ATPase [Polyangium mundeleinium]